jgi:hypothetical protein
VLFGMIELVAAAIVHASLGAFGMTPGSLSIAFSGLSIFPASQRPW